MSSIWFWKTLIIVGLRSEAHRQMESANASIVPFRMNFMLYSIPEEDLHLIRTDAN